MCVCERGGKESAGAVGWAGMRARLGLPPSPQMVGRLARAGCARAAQPRRHAPDEGAVL
jgi:hypothetical protein